MKHLIFALGIASLFALPLARADVVFLPESHHHQYLTYGLFLDENSAALYRTGGRAWGNLGGAIALFEENNLPTKPQLVFHAVVNAAYHMTPKGDAVAGETVDDRLGASFEFALQPDLRFSIGWEHWSGHASDDIPDRELIGPNLGDEMIPMRLVYDYQDLGRVGTTLRPVVGSEPGIRPFFMDQFIEVFPWRAQKDFRKATPYVSVGFEEYGRNYIVFTYHAQLGVYFGSHLEPEHHPTLRLAIGYYNGIDPRMKYAQFKDTRQNFGYGGVLVNF